MAGGGSAEAAGAASTGFSQAAAGAAGEGFPQAGSPAGAVPTAATPPAPTGTRTTGPTSSTSPTTAFDPLLRADPWVAYAGAAPGPSGAGAAPGPSSLTTTRPLDVDLTRFEINFKMWEGPGRDRKPLDLVKDSAGYCGWRDRTLTVIACRYPMVRDLLLAAEREKGPIDEAVELALAAKVGIAVSPAEVRMLSSAIFANVKIILHDTLGPTTQAVGSGHGLELWRKLHDLGRGSSDLINREKIKLYSYPNRCATMDDLAVKFDLWRGLRAQLESLGEVFTERQHWMALDELVPQSLLAEMQTKIELDSYSARLDFVSRRVSYHRTMAQRLKIPAQVDASGDALMAAMSVPVPSGSSEGSPGALAETVSALQQQLFAIQSDLKSNAGDLDALGKGGNKGKKGRKQRRRRGRRQGRQGRRRRHQRQLLVVRQFRPPPERVPRPRRPERAARLRERGQTQGWQGVEGQGQGEQGQGNLRGRLGGLPLLWPGPQRDQLGRILQLRPGLFLGLGGARGRAGSAYGCRLDYSSALWTGYTRASGTECPGSTSFGRRSLGLRR